MLVYNLPATDAIVTAKKDERGLASASVVLSVQRFRLPCDVDGYPSCLVVGQDLCLPSFGFVFGRVDEGERLAICVTDDVTERNGVGVPRCRETAW
jgi:hypothetical protein